VRSLFLLRGTPPTQGQAVNHPHWGVALTNEPSHSQNPPRVDGFASISVGQRPGVTSWLPIACWAGRPRPSSSFWRPRPAMAATPSSLAMRRTAIRERIYTLLLSQPRKVWTVRQVTDALASGGRVSDDMVRPVLYVLLADHIMAAVSGSRALTLTLSADGVEQLRSEGTLKQVNMAPRLRKDI